MFSADSLFPISRSFIITGMIPYTTIQCMQKSAISGSAADICQRYPEMALLTSHQMIMIFLSHYFSVTVTFESPSEAISPLLCVFTVTLLSFIVSNTLL